MMATAGGGSGTGVAGPWFTAARAALTGVKAMAAKKSEEAENFDI